MAKLRGDLLVLKTQKDGSGQATYTTIAGTTSFSFDSSAEFLETTDQTDGLNTSGIAGKVTRTISGDYFAATDLDSFTDLYAYQAAGSIVPWQVLNDGVEVMSGDAVITSLNISGGTSADLVTGSYSLAVTGTVTTS